MTHHNTKIGIDQSRTHIQRSSLLQDIIDTNCEIAIPSSSNFTGDFTFNFELSTWYVFNPHI